MFKDNETKKILFLGPKASYTEVAKENFIKDMNIKNSEAIVKNTILSILEEIDNTNDTNTYAVIPVENSIEGVVRETLDNLTRLDNKEIKIIAETVVPINHCLATKAKELNQIRTITSHPQALAQCRSFIHNNFDENVKIETANSTSMSIANLANLDETHAAIGNENAAELYNIPVLLTNINDEKDNKTRFILLGTKKTLPTGNDKTSITFSTENKPGALNKILNILADYQINMTYIDSRPSKKFLGEYTFYIDFDGHIEDEKIKKAICEIKEHTKSFTHLGSFKKYIY